MPRRQYHAGDAVIAEAVQPLTLLERTNSYLEYQRGEGIPRLTASPSTT